MKNAKLLLQEAGSGFDDVCKLRVYSGYRAYREPVYWTKGYHLKGVHPVGTGLVVDGFDNPRVLIEIDLDAVIQG